MAFNKARLQNAMSNLASSGKIFSNESQFQFDLARELRKMGFDVELEVLSADCTPSQFAALPKEDKKKYYTDIVVKDDNEFIAIELKYKTPDVGGLMCYHCNRKAYYLAAQGAENANSYLFWKDVERLEKMVGGQCLNFDSSKAVKKGYAILLTNDKLYWEGNKKGASVAQAFFPKKDTVANGCLQGTLRRSKASINLQGAYCIDHACVNNAICSGCCTWEKYLDWNTTPSISEVTVFQKKSSASTTYTKGSAKLPGYLADGFSYLIVEVSNVQPACK